MSLSPTSKPTPINNAAKDDAVGQDGDFTFTVADLLANDPGGAAKVSVATQFLFGSTQWDYDHQSEYLDAHGIIANDDGTFTLTEDAIDFKYSVQIGNKGTWSVADVDVTAPPCEPSAGEVLFSENFDEDGGTRYYDPAYATVENPTGFVFEATNLDAYGWTGAANTELGATGYGGIVSTSGDAWLDTQNSPGPIDISNTFEDPTGGQVQLSFDIGTQSLDYLGQHYETDSKAMIQFKIDGNVVAEFTAEDFETANVLQHFEVVVDTGAAGSHTLELVDVTGVDGFTGFAVDSIKIVDWVC
jgi:hypothetical protein